MEVEALVAEEKAAKKLTNKDKKCDCFHSPKMQAAQNKRNANQSCPEITLRSMRLAETKQYTGKGLQGTDMAWRQGLLWERLWKRQAESGIGGWGGATY